MLYNGATTPLTDGVRGLHLRVGHAMANHSNGVAEACRGGATSPPEGNLLPKALSIIGVLCQGPLGGPRVLTVLYISLLGAAWGTPGHK